MGWLTKFVDIFTERSRQEKYKLFLSLLKPSPSTKILDVGVSVGELRASDNLLEKLYPHKDGIIAASIQQFDRGKWAYPQVTYVQADGRFLPFRDNAFDVVYSNAVIEHVGTREDQRRFVAECSRVGKAAFITTPNRWFVLEVHTKMPFLGWLPRSMFREVVDRRFGKGYPLNPLGFRDFRNLFPGGCNVRIIGQTIIPFWPHAWVAVAVKGED